MLTNILKDLPLAALFVGLIIGFAFLITEKNYEPTNNNLPNNSNSHMYDRY